ncbi:MAG: hypothetical protein IPK08_15765 [Bacteroidetes bacterium]|nr:hypothetical protein [Bacteroidota bacterium]
MTDVELLEFICSNEDDQQAYDQFVMRFLPDIQNHCEKICKIRKLHIHVGQQIAHETFEKIRKYKSFKKNEAVNGDDRKSILVYLKDNIDKHF